MWGTKIKDLPFYLVVKAEQEIWRAADFWIKEPETIAWIDTFTEDDIFFDVGANIGVFSLYAAHRRILTQSFEPERLNLRSLDLNRHIYGYTGNDISRWFYQNNAVSDIDGKSTLYVPKSGPGQSGGQIGEAMHENGQEFVPDESYEVETYKIDTLAERFGVPNHIKIDVDGIEWRILQGGSATLAHQDVKSVLVEVNKDHGDIETFMTDRGFTSFNRFNGPDLNRRINQKQYNKIYIRKT